ncbi:hypothetical protein B0T21DRAFT_429950 [Apiosordaria backusii]|uniref:Uncharacterized protein n=1 Tax=Apiosordaria backusii TaxID=314023 RepID=A0AA40ET60_9PEZI|nr:hypothetical protein B0T21DRAFT_429950 [Apiosordaria backusii]
MVFFARLATVWVGRLIAPVDGWPTESFFMQVQCFSNDDGRPSKNGRPPGTQVGGTGAEETDDIECWYPITQHVLNDRSTDGEDGNGQLGSKSLDKQLRTVDPSMAGTFCAQGTVAGCHGRLPCLPRCFQRGMEVNLDVRNTYRAAFANAGMIRWIFWLLYLESRGDLGTLAAFYFSPHASRPRNPSLCPASPSPSLPTFSVVSAPWPLLHPLPISCPALLKTFLVPIASPPSKAASPHQHIVTAHTVATTKPIRTLTETNQNRPCG